MELRIINRHAEVSDALRQYIEKKLSKLDRLLPNVQEALVELSSYQSKNQGELNVAEATVHAGKAVLRAEVEATDQFAAVDEMYAKLQRQIERYKGKRSDRFRGRGQVAAYPAEVEAREEAVLDEESEAEGPIVRRKSFPTYPMDEAEAIEQMELLGHDFYLYQNTSTGQINLVYRRRGGGYGILEPEIA